MTHRKKVVGRNLEEKKLQECLERNEGLQSEILHALCNFPNRHAALLTEDGEISPISHELSKMSQWTLIDCSWINEVLEQDRPLLRSSTAKAFLNNALVETEIRRTSASGSQQWFLGSFIPLQNFTPRLVLFIGKDITEQKKVELAYQERTNFVEVLADHLPGMIGYWSRDLRCQFANVEYLTWFGRTKEETLGIEMTKLLGLELFKKNEPYIRAALRGEMQKFERAITKPNGETGYTSAQYVPHWVNGEVIGFYAIVIDISERKLAEEARAHALKMETAARAAAEESNRAKDDFLATLSHEIRTPLTSILGYTQELKERITEKDALEILTIIERSAKAQGQLINDLLDVSRITSNKLLINRKPMPFLPALRAAFDASYVMAEAKQINMEMQVATGEVWINGDELRLQQIFNNLLTNAIKFTPPGGKIVVRLEQIEDKSGKKIQISFQDTGIGIRADNLDRIFLRFNQADSSLTRVHGGLGLGLSIVQSLAEMHDGSVCVKSAGLGKGSTFTVQLPVFNSDKSLNADRNEKLTEPPKSQLDEKSLRLDGIKVIVVDDSIDNRNLISIILKSFGAEVRLAESPSECISELKEFVPDIIVSDISMPLEDGYSLLKRVQDSPDSKVSHLPVIALTAYAGSDDAQKMLRAGFVAHLPKPVERENLIRLISQVTGLTH